MQKAVPQTDQPTEKVIAKAFRILYFVAENERSYGFQKAEQPSIENRYLGNSQGTEALMFLKNDMMEI